MSLVAALTRLRTTLTQVLYQFAFIVPAGNLKDAAKKMEALRTNPPPVLKNLQYTAVMSASQSTVDAIRQTLLPQVFADAQKKAQTLAAAAGVKLGAIKGVTETFYLFLFLVLGGVATAQTIAVPVSPSVNLALDEAVFTITVGTSLDSTVQQVKQALEEIGLPNPTVVSNGLGPDSANVNGTAQIHYSAGITLAAGSARDAAKRLDEARIQGQSLAAAAGLKLGPIRAITDAQAGVFATPFFAAASGGYTFALTGILGTVP